MAARAVAGMAVRLSARTGRFNRNIGKSAGVIGNLRQSVTGAIGPLVKFGGTITAIAGGAGLAALIKSQFSAIDALAKTSDKLGETTEAMAGLGLAAKLAGIPVTQMQTAVQRLTRRASEAAMNTGEAKDAIKELGIDAAVLNAQRPAEKIKTIADAFQGVKNQADRVRLAFKLFDTEGVAMVNLMKDGGDAIADTIAEAETLGLAINRIDAAKVEMANDAWTKMRSLISGLAQQLAVTLAPILTDVADRFVGVAKAGGGAGNLVSEAWHGTARLVAKIADALEGFIAVWDFLRGTVATAVTGIIGSITELLKAIQKVADFFGIGGVGTGRLPIEELENLTEGFAQTARDAFADAGKHWDNFTKGVASSKLEDYLVDVNKRADELAGKMAGLSPFIARPAEAVAAAAAAASQRTLQGPRSSRERISTFRQISLSRTAIPAGGVSQTTKDPQLEENNRLLSNILLAIKKQGLA